MDGDTTFPTICGTGTEDYFASYNFENQETKQYQVFSTPYTGSPGHQTGRLYKSQQRFGMYRWHLAIRSVRVGSRVTIQALGWRADAGICLQDNRVGATGISRAARAVPKRGQDTLEVK